MTLEKNSKTGQGGPQTNQDTPDAKLAPPARYFPPTRGLYEVKPGLHYFGEDFGNPADDKIFQLDSEFVFYRERKLEARAERLEKYCLSDKLTTAMQARVCGFIAQKLASEYPDFFKLSSGSANSHILHCALSGERLVFAADWELRDTIFDRSALQPPYVSGLDALASQIQEDLALISVDSENGNWLSALHLCFPNHWSGAEKIGQDFTSIHEPVAGIESINHNADKIVEIMIHKGPYVRFAWGLATDRYLNHHPEPAPEHDPDIWQGRRFDPTKPELYLRVERQVIWGLPDINSSLFTIRTSFIDVNDIKAKRSQNRRLQMALESMTPASLEYKDLVGQEQAILKWLRT